MKKDHINIARNVEDLGSASDPILLKLKTALRTDGDFPLRAKVVTDLRSLINRPNVKIEKISETILREPSLGTRVLHLVNSAFYQRTKPITTITQAVMHIGMRALSDLCAGLILLQRFIPAAKRGGIFADNLKRSILTSLLANLVDEVGEEDTTTETGYLAGTFANLGYLLLAYYFPQVYEAASKRSIARNHDVSQSITEILGITRLELNLTILEALDIPQFYHQIIKQAFDPKEEKLVPELILKLSRSVAVADALANAIITAGCKENLNSAVENIAEKFNCSHQHLFKVILELPEEFEQHCRLVDMGFLNLPDYMTSLSEPENELKTSTPVAQNQFAKAVDEMRQAITSGEPVSSIITSAMETMVYLLGYDRALLLLINFDRTFLTGRMVLGKSHQVDPKSIKLQISGSSNQGRPEMIAYSAGTPQIFGNPLFEDGWPFAAIPVGIGDKCLGVIYADIVSNNKQQGSPQDSSAQAALMILTELLDKAASENNLAYQRQ